VRYLGRVALLDDRMAFAAEHRLCGRRDCGIAGGWSPGAYDVLCPPRTQNSAAARRSVL